MKKSLRTIAFCLVALAGLALSAPAFALDLQQAKQQGLVGEQLNGYVGVVASGNAEASALVADINAKRKQEYERISKENGQPVNIVEKLAAEKLIGRTGAGEYFQNPAGGWVKK